MTDVLAVSPSLNLPLPVRTEGGVRLARLLKRAADDRSMVRLMCLDLRIVRDKLRQPRFYTGENLDKHRELRRKLRVYAEAWTETRADIRALRERQHEHGLRSLVNKF